MFEDQQDRGLRVAYKLTGFKQNHENNQSSN